MATGPRHRAPAGGDAHTDAGGPRGGLDVSARGVVYIYRLEGSEVVALSSVDLEVRAGERVALLGPSGAGKSTLLRLLGGLQTTTAGRLRVGRYDLHAATPAQLDQLRATDIGMVLQGGATNLLPYADARDNIRFAQRAARRVRRDVPLPTPERVLELVGIGDLARRRPHELRVGELQRLALAVGVACSPGLLLADEPTSQLDDHHRDQVIDAIEAVNADLGTTVVVVTHDLEVASRFPRTVTIRDGRIGAEGRGGEEFAVVGRDGAVQLPPAVQDAFPPGTLLRVDVDGDGRLLLTPADGGTPDAADLSADHRAADPGRPS